MIDIIRFQDQAACELIRPVAQIAEQLHCRGRFQVEHWRAGKLIGTCDIRNAIVNEGKNKLLDVMFHGVTAIGTWYILLVDGAGTPTLAAGDTYAQINGTNGWDEYVGYTEATRGEWTEGAASSQSITNASPVVFNMNASGSVYGLGAVGGGSAPSTKNDAAGGGVLWAAAQFSSGTVVVLNGDQLKVTYTVNA
jgi:hypothetical protein